MMMGEREGGKGREGQGEEVRKEDQFLLLEAFLKSFQSSKYFVIHN